MSRSLRTFAVVTMGTYLRVAGWRHGIAALRRAIVEHEATTSKIGDDQLFYCLQRGISEEDAVNMIVNGFCKEVFRELPMEFAVEAQNLMNVSLEGAVG